MATKRKGDSTRERRFFARVDRGKLVPMDPTGFNDGATYLVVAVPSPVPHRLAERRILAAARSIDLPSDFAQQHDHYAHGAPRR